MGHALEAGGALELPEGEADHVLRVLRGREWDLVEVVDGAGRLFVAELRGGRRADVVEELALAGAEDVEISLYQAIPKGGRMDLVVEKATEVGVSTIVPVVAERGVVNPRQGKIGRWRRLVEAAARQSLRLRVPEVREPVPFERAVREVEEAGVLLQNAPGLDVVEPEGGWGAGELRLAEEVGLTFAQLGPYRLRSETAGMVAVARAQAALESRVRACGGR